jgi:hypothetical protein
VESLYKTLVVYNNIKLFMKKGIKNE